MNMPRCFLHRLKSLKYFSLLLPSLTLILFASTASAYMKIDIKSSPLTWYDEYYHLAGDDYRSFMDFFSNEKIEFDIALIIPDLPFETHENFYLTFSNPVVSVNTSTFFNSITIDNSYFVFEQTKGEDYLFSDWAINVTISEDVGNGETRRGSFYAHGWFTSNNEGAISRAMFDYYQDNWLYRRQSEEYRLFSGAFFEGYEAGTLTVERISVPEPFAPALFLTGLIFIAINQRMRKRKISNC